MSATTDKTSETSNLPVFLLLGIDALSVSIAESLIKNSSLSDKINVRVLIDDKLSDPSYQSELSKLGCECVSISLDKPTTLGGPRIYHNVSYIWLSSRYDYFNEKNESPMHETMRMHNFALNLETVIRGSAFQSFSDLNQASMVTHTVKAVFYASIPDFKVSITNSNNTSDENDVSLMESCDICSAKPALLQSLSEMHIPLISIKLPFLMDTLFEYFTPTRQLFSTDTLCLWALPLNQVQQRCAVPFSCYSDVSMILSRLVLNDINEDTPSAISSAISAFSKHRNDDSKKDNESKNDDKDDDSLTIASFMAKSRSDGSIYFCSDILSFEMVIALLNESGALTKASKKEVKHIDLNPLTGEQFKVLPNWMYPACVKQLLVDCLWHCSVSLGGIEEIVTQQYTSDLQWLNTRLRKDDSSKENKQNSVESLTRVQQWFHRDSTHKLIRRTVFNSGKTHPLFGSLSWTRYMVLWFGSYNQFGFVSLLVSVISIVIAVVSILISYV